MSNYEWVKYLQHSDIDLNYEKSSRGKTVTVDNLLFTKWTHESMTTYRLIDLFKRNNKIPGGVNINASDFEDWLNSLGYYR